MDVMTKNSLLDERALSKLKWRCRRGLLENDLFIERFFQRFEPTLTVNHALALGQLMDLSDNDLLDLLMERKTLEAVATSVTGVTSDMQEVLGMLKSKQFTQLKGSP